MRSRRGLRWAAASAIAVCAALPAGLQAASAQTIGAQTTGAQTTGAQTTGTQSSVADFYKSHQLNIIVGSSPGGGYDTYARLIARHIGRHIPGQPSVAVTNMPGAGGNILANQLYNVGPKDGTAIAAPQSGVILEPLLGVTPVKHDPSKFIYLGSANNDVYICVARADAPFTTFAQMLEHEIILGANNASSAADYPRLLNNVLGTKFRIVTGYAGSREIGLAIDKNEAHGACGLAWPSISVTSPDWFLDGPVGAKSRMRVIVQLNSTGHPELNKAGVPLAVSFAKTPEQKAILELYFSQSTFGRPFFLPPGVPAERAQALIKAFAETTADPDYLAEAKRMRLDVDVVPAAVVQSTIEGVYAAKPELIAKTKAALQAAN